MILSTIHFAPHSIALSQHDALKVIGNAKLEAGLAEAGPSAHPLKQIADELLYPLLACVTEQSFRVRKRNLDASDSELPLTSSASSGRG